jgi:hypothetical protein
LRFIYSIALLALSFQLVSQRDSVKTTQKLGCSVSLINFMDYGFLKADVSNKYGYYQGFDMSLIIRSRIRPFQMEIGVLGGNAYPIIHNLNFYLGGSCLLFSKNKKFILDINPKLMIAYDSKPYTDGVLIVHKNISLQLGINIFRKIKNLEIGLGYYYWASDESILLKEGDHPPNNPYIKFGDLYHKTGYVPIGIVKITARYLFGK